MRFHARLNWNVLQRSMSMCAAAVVLTSVIVGCGGNGNGGKDTPTPTSSSASGQGGVTATAGQTVQSFGQAAEIGGVKWATALDQRTNQPLATVDSFSTNASVIYAALPVRFLSSQSAVSATWTYNNTSLDSLATSSLGGTGLSDGWIEFHLARPDGAEWPDGTYAISVSLDGKVVQNARIQVK